MKTSLPVLPGGDLLVYPGAQLLDISSVEWHELSPPIGISGEPEALLQHRAWRTGDLGQKVITYYDQAMFDANWQPMQTDWESDGGWTSNRFRKGDDQLSLGIIENLSSAAISHFPDISLEPGDTLIIMAIGNPLNAYLARGRDLLDSGDWEAAKNYAERVASSRLQAGVGIDDPYVQDAVTLLAEALRQMTPVDAARLWLRGSVTADVFGPERAEALYLMRRLGLVREYEGGIIDSYLPTGEWREISNDGTTAVVELVGVAEAKMSNRLIPQAEVESFDYRLQLTLQRDEEGIWEIDEDARFVVGGGNTGEAASSSLPPADLGDINTAIAEYRTTLEINPDSVTALSQLAHLLTIRRSYDEAVELARRATELASDNPDTHATLAMALDWAGQPDAAIEAALRALDLNEQHVPALAYLAEAYSDKGRWKPSMESAQQAVEIDRNNYMAWRSLGYAREAQGDYQGAIDAYRRAISLQFDLSYVYLDVARNLRVLGNTEGAITEIERAIEVDPNDPAAHDQRGLIFYTNQEYERAATEIQKAVEANPDYALPYGHLGWVLYAQRQYGEAINQFKKALELGAESVEYYYQIGLSYAFIDQCEEAIPWFEKALEIDPNARPAHEGMQLCEANSQ